MSARLLMAALAATFLAGGAGMAQAQGSITQDPGRIALGNLTFQNLGPAAGGPASGETTRAGRSNSEPGTAGTSTGTWLPQSGSGSAGTGAVPGSGLGGTSPRAR